MFFACPSVTRRVGGIPEVIENNVTGILSAADDADALACAVESLIKDSARRVAMGRAARQRAENSSRARCRAARQRALELFSAAIVVPRYEALYRRVCECRP